MVVDTNLTPNPTIADLVNTIHVSEDPTIPPLPPNPPFRTGTRSSGSRSRDASLNRGRTAYTAHGLVPGSRTPSTHPAIPEGSTDSTAVPPPDPTLQRRISNKHNRQTSVIHGVHHSRNTSFNSPLASSPLSPESLYNASLKGLAPRRAYTHSPENDAALPAAHVNTLSIDSTIHAALLHHDPQDTVREETTPSRGRKDPTVMTSYPARVPPRHPADFAMQHLFQAFVIKADQKVNACLARSEYSLSPVEETCAYGVDSSFDQLLTALAHVTREYPKPLVDSLMLWRQAKADAVSNYKKRQGQKSPAITHTPLQIPIRRLTEPAAAHAESKALPNTPAHAEEYTVDEYAVLDRQATVSIYILCRGLLEIFEQSTLPRITSDLANRLEDIVFSQLRTFEPTHMHTSRIRPANWKIYGHLLAQMSVLDFTRVSARFVQQLKSWQQEIANCTDTNTVREIEARTELMLACMVRLRVPIEPQMLNHACEFLSNVAHLFANAHGPRIKPAYCAVTESLLAQVVPCANIIQDMASFREVQGVIAPRVTQMLTKMRHWSSASPVSTILLCTAQLDSLSAQWISSSNILISKVRDRTSRTSAMRSIAQLTWSYLFRTTEPLETQVRKIEEIVRAVLPAGKKTFTSTEKSTAEAFLTFTDVISARFPEVAVKSIVLPLLQHEAITSAKDLKIEQLDPEKLLLGIKAFLLLMIHIEKPASTRAKLPTWSTALPLPDNAPSSPVPSDSASSLHDARDSGGLKVLAPFRDSALDPSHLHEVDKATYRKFCEVLSKVAQLCDQAFGNLTNTIEKPVVLTPKTPLTEAFALGRRDESAPAELHQLYLDLMETTIQALPACSTELISLNSIVTLLCVGLAHVRSDIAHASMKSLRVLAERDLGQQICTMFPRFVFGKEFNQRAAIEDSDDRLGTSLELFVELLHTWIRQIQARAETDDISHERPADSHAARALQTTSILPLVDEVESLGLFFMCSYSRLVRYWAIHMLRLVPKIDQALGGEVPARVIEILETNALQILDIAEDNLTVWERSRLQKDKQRKGAQNVLIELCCSESQYDSAIWFKAFPNVIKHIFDTCPNVVALSRNRVCARLSTMHPVVEDVFNSTQNHRDAKMAAGSHQHSIELLLEQWKLYLIMACVTLNNSGAQTQSQLANTLHARKTSKNSTVSPDSFNTARALFPAVISMLGANNNVIRSGIVTALSSISHKLFQTLLESLQYVTYACLDEVKLRIASHHRTPSSPSRTQRTDRIRVEVAHIYKNITCLLKHEELVRDTWVVNNILNHARSLRLFLSDTEVHLDWRHTRLRYYYCGLVEEIFAQLSSYPDLTATMSFESRRAAYSLMEEWCGYVTESAMGLTLGEDMAERSQLAKEKSNLRLAALSAMATLCAGPISVIVNSSVSQFNQGRMLSWIDSIFEAREQRIHEIGQRALRNLIVHNPDISTFAEHAIQCCYGVRGPVALHNCFNVVTDILLQNSGAIIDLVKALTVVIFTLGHEDREVRIRSAKVLRALDSRRDKYSNLQHFDISISDKTRAVYKSAQFEYSKRLAQTHPDLAYQIFSEFCLRFKGVGTDIQRGMVATILPWVQTLELQLSESTSAPTPWSNMLMSNMIEITVTSSRLLHNEVQALWQALVTGPYAGNVQFILNFMIELCLERREQNFVDYAKQIVVYLSTTLAGSKVFEFLLLQFAPKYMANDRRPASTRMHEIPLVSYTADLRTVLPMGHRQAGLSLGQISMILLVDLIVPQTCPSQEDTLKLLHAVFVLWDHHMPSVQEQARELLVHMMHVLLIVKVDAGVSELQKKQAEGLIEMIRKDDFSITWSYRDHTGKDDFESQENRVPVGMRCLARQLIELFDLVFDNFSGAWARQALYWASTCPVIHLACRSFQVYRCMSARITPRMLGDMLARLSNTISDEQADYQTFSLEILTTLKLSISTLDRKEISRYPQIFWTMAACLETIHEREYFEALGILVEIIEQIDLAETLIVDTIARARPKDWEGDFFGIQAQVYKGLKSSECMQRASQVLHKLARLPDSEILGQHGRVMYGTLAYLPYLSRSSKLGTISPEMREYSRALSQAASVAGNIALAHALGECVDSADVQDGKVVTAVLQKFKADYLPGYQAECLIFLLDLLSNGTPWFRDRILSILAEFMPHIDMSDTTITRLGPELMVPLLRLLDTEHCQQALGLMDFFTSQDLRKQDREHMRVTSTSRTPTDTNGQVLPNLFGTPTSSGWTVSTSPTQSMQTRNNVHHVFFTCNESDSMTDTPVDTPDLGFQPVDDESDSYFPQDVRADTLRPYPPMTDTNMGDIVNSLDDLDDFFEEPESPTTPTGSTSNGASNSFTFLDGYDTEQGVYATSGLGYRSNLSSMPTSSSASSSSHLDSMAASFTAPYRPLEMANIGMSTKGGSGIHAGALSTEDGPGPELPTESHRGPLLPIPATISIQARPALHARSVTSPMNRYTTVHSSLVADVPPMPVGTSLGLQPQFFSDTGLESMVVEAENIPFPPLVSSTTHTGAKSVSSTTPTSATAESAANFMRRGMRRLTGGRSEGAKEKARLRAPSAGQSSILPGPSGVIQSPRVPRVPLEYLHGLSGNVTPIANTPMSLANT